MLFVCAAGNSHMNIDTTPVYPAAFDSSNIITVASIDRNGVLSGFSNYGENTVDVSAPGEDIISTLPGNKYYASSGTSMSTAFVSGEAALILSMYGNISVSEIKQKILSTSDQLSSLKGKVYNGYKINCNNAVLNLSTNEIIQVNSKEYNYDNSINTQNADGYSLYSSGTWVTKGYLPTARSGIQSVALNGYIYVSGYTNELYRYDPSTNTWTQMANANTARSHHAMATANGKIYVIGGSNSSYLNSVEEYDPSTNTWTTKANMPTTRAYICAAVVNNIIYVFGGSNGYGELNTLEAYNPLTNTWTRKANMLTGMQSAGAASINGQIYVVGGVVYNGSQFGQFLNSMEMYDPTNNTWTLKASMSSYRAGAGVQALGGKLYAIAGFPFEYSISDSVEEYEPLSNTWSFCPNIPTARKFFGTAVVDNMIYAIGGSNGSYDLTSVEGYTPTLFNDDYGDGFSAAEPMQVETEKTGNINYAGDVDFFSFVPTSNTSYDIFTTGSTDTYGYLYNSSGVQLAYNDDFSGSRNFHITMSLQSGLTYYVKVRHYGSTGTGSYGLRVAKVIPVPNTSSSPTNNSITVAWGAVQGATGYEIEVDGVVKDNGASLSYQHTGLTPDKAHIYRVRAKNSINTSVWSDRVFDVAYGSGWKFGANMPTPRRDLGVTELNGKVYAIGGSNSVSTYLNTVEEFNPVNNTWTTKANMPTARLGLGVIALNGKIYAIGGYTSSGSINKVEEFDPVLNTWTTKANMPTARYGFGIIALNGRIYSIGGYNGSTRLSTVEEFDPVSNIWVTKASMPTARYSLGVASVNGKIYAIDGYNGSTYLNTVEEFDTASNTWAIKATAPTARDNLGVAVVNGKMYAVGGYGSSGFLNTVEVYDPIANTWTSQVGKPIASTSCNLGVITANGRIYVIGGFNSSYGYLNSVEELQISINLEFIYDQNNRLTDIYKGGVSYVKYVYDNNGNLISKQILP